MPRMVDADGSYTLKASDYTGYSLAFSGGNIAVIDEFGHIEAEFDAGDIPTIEAEPVKHGRWDGEGDGYADGEIVIDVWYCSECGHCIDEGIDDPHILPNYCPNCGAKMDGGKDHA